MKQRLMQKEKVYGSFIANPGWAGYIEILKHHGYDFVVFDTEHSPMSYENLESYIRTARLAGIQSIIRVNDHQYSLFARAMDMGCDSIMIPRVEYAEQLREMISWAKYPPAGRRGGGGYMTLFEPDKAKFLRDANEKGIIMVQIESQEGIRNLEAILEVPGVDVILVGPFDLSIDLGVPGDTKHPKMVEAIEGIIAKCQGKGVPVGIHLGSAAEAKYWSERGITVLSLASDLSALYVRAKENIETARGY